ncbi:prephenate dehydratase [Adlercreutzia murintestinalis]|uniref:prephenate dehydratase n=1 Tax=Adlercreutzia murintestinalis TaxID=2941325 RepID=UPI0020424EE0|nr:prephenate dehydratase [Adlercreutzia murintestinalis]
MTDIDHTIAFLGPRGTYTHEAANVFASALGIKAPDLLECASFDEVFDAVDRGRAAFGVVGKENSLEGPVTATLDNFAFRSSAVILAETVIDIHHCLVTAPGVALGDIQTVASHSQGLAQCRRYLNERLPGRNTQIMPSTAESARLAASDPTIAGIANAFAARLHGCDIAAADIEDHLGNQTAFALIGRLGSAPQLVSDDYKTTLALFLREDKAGALHMILSEFAYAGINITMLQSRPLKQQFGDYMFFMEFLGKDIAPDVQTALSCLRLKLREVKVLGSYPVIPSA